MTFPLAPMDQTVRGLTLVCLSLPILLASGAVATGQPALLIPALLTAVLCTFVWLWMRPWHFDVANGELRIVWPLRARRYMLADTATAEVISRGDLRARYGRGVRVGAGGLWGGFGWLWTSRGIVQMYVSRLDNLVLVRRGQGRPLLLSPADPDAFVSAVVAARHG